MRLPNNIKKPDFEGRLFFVKQRLNFLGIIRFMNPNKINFSWKYQNQILKPLPAYMLFAF